MDNIESILKQVNRLSIKEREKILAQISVRLGYEKKKKAERRYRFLVDVAQKATGIIMNPERRNDHDVRARMIIAYKMYSEGISYEAIGKAMNRKHESVMYLVKKMAGIFAFPLTHEDDIDLYWKFCKMIKDKEDEQGIHTCSDTVPVERIAGE